jgi:lysozyme
LDGHASLRRWALAAAEAGGMMVHLMKATQGSGATAFVDPTFVARAAATPAAGLLPGAYHYFDATDPGAQAALFLNVAASLPKLALDLEPDQASETMQNNAAVFVQLVYQATGEWPLLYTGRWSVVAPVNPILFNCPLSLAEYGNNPICPPGWSEWKLWQHTDGRVGSFVAPVPGIGACDRSRFAGTPAELAQWWAGSRSLRSTRG